MVRKLAIALLLGVFLSGCGEDKTENAVEETHHSKPRATVPEKPEYGGRLIEPMLGEPTNLIPPLATDSGSHTIASLIYVAPLKYNKNIELVPWAAKSYEVLEEGKLLRFTLRKDIRWFDGVPLTARDVEFTYKLMIDPKTPTAYSSDFKMVKEFRVLDDYTFEVRYDEVFARALATWAHDILPRHILENEDLLNTKYSRQPVGAGAFRLKEWVPGRKVVLEPNRDFFEGRPYLDQIVYRVIPDIGTQFLELKAGHLDSMGLTPKQYLFQSNGPKWDDGYNKFKYLAFGYSFLGYNLERPLFKDKKVRQALAYAIDRDELVKGVLFGLGVPTVGPYKPGTWVYNDTISPYAYDPERAETLLAEAGWRDSDGDGVLDREGRPFAFTIITNQGNTQRIKTATVIQERLKKIGIVVNVRTVEWAAFIKEFVNKGNFDAVILSWNIIQDPDIFTVWHSSQFPPSGLNFIHYKNEELDRLLEEGRSTLDQSRRKRIYDRIQEILYEDQPYCFLYVPYALPIVQSRFQGIEAAPAGIGYNLPEWWVPKSMQRFSIKE